MADCTAGITASSTSVSAVPTVESSLVDAGRLAFRVAMRLLRHREDAEDVAQEACVRALERFPTLRDRARFRSWLVRVAWRLAIDRRRADSRRGRRDAHLVPVEGNCATAEHDLIARERALHLQAAIDRLPEKLREPLVLSGLNGHSVDEIAQRLALPPGTIKSRSFEARRRLKLALTGAGFVVLLAIGIRLAIVRTAVDPGSDRLSTAKPTFAASVSLPTAEAPRAPATVNRDDVIRLDVPNEPALGPPSIDQVRVPVVTCPTLSILHTALPVVSVPTIRVPVVEVPVVNGSATAAAPGFLEKQS